MNGQESNKVTTETIIEDEETLKEKKKHDEKELYENSTETTNLEEKDAYPEEKNGLAEKEQFENDGQTRYFVQTRRKNSISRNGRRTA